VRQNDVIITAFQVSGLNEEELSLIIVNVTIAAIIPTNSKPAFIVSTS